MLDYFQLPIMLICDFVFFLYQSVSYADLARHNLDVATDSIRRGIAGIAGVSPLRITNMFVSTS